MYQIIIVVHVLLGLGIIGFVLMQQGKGADAGAAFGGGSSGSVFGAQGASSFLSRTTAILATLFFASSLGLAILSNYQDSEIDLMDTPDVEDVLADVPLIDEDNKTVLDADPAIQEDLPAMTQEKVSNLADDTTQETPLIEESIENQPKAVTEQTKLLNQQ